MCRVDVSTAFLQADAFPVGDEPRYIYYKPYPGAEVEYYQLLGPLYGSRTSPMHWYNTLRGWFVTEAYTQGKN